MMNKIMGSLKSSTSSRKTITSSSSYSSTTTTSASENHTALDNTPPSLEEFQEEALKVHNKYRAQHGTPSLVLDKKLCASATMWANELAKSKTLKHSPCSDYGENVYMSMGKKVSADDAVKSWYDEIKDYNFSKPGFLGSTGHFTQVVWKASTKLGVGFAQSGSLVYVVAQYNPPGNVQNQFDSNVLKKGTSLEDDLSRMSIKPSEPIKAKFSNSNFQLDTLNFHNDLRRKHHAPELTLDSGLCATAQEWANYLMASGKFEHSTNGYGENLYMASGMEVKGFTAVQAWYDEIKDYDFNHPGFSNKTGHFTQVVWKGSKALGVAIASKGNTHIVVANYDPPGNYAGRFPENVLPI